MSTAERPPPDDPWCWYRQTVFYHYQQKLVSAFKRTLSRDNESMALIGQPETAVYPDGWEDESHIQVFIPPLHFSEQRGQWVARFYDPAPEENDYVEWTHAELEDCSRLFKEITLSTTQTDKALEAFRAHIDREVFGLQHQSPA